jgi:hypothetical protein
MTFIWIIVAPTVVFKIVVENSTFNSGSLIERFLTVKMTACFYDSVNEFTETTNSRRLNQ